MSKKNLKDGLESLFGGPAIAEPSLPENSPLLERTEVEKKSVAKNSATNHKKRSKSGKNFTSDLDTLFEAALGDNIKEGTTDVAYNNTQTTATPKRRTSVVGLDALIQKTTDGNMDYTSTKKRVTFIFEKKNLDKLKKIAKSQNSFLKDIIGKIVAEHIAKYDEEGFLLS